MRLSGNVGELNGTIGWKSPI